MPTKMAEAAKVSSNQLTEQCPQAGTRWARSTEGGVSLKQKDLLPRSQQGYSVGSIFVFLHGVLLRTKMFNFDRIQFIYIFVLLLLSGILSKALLYIPKS